VRNIGEIFQWQHELLVSDPGPSQGRHVCRRSPRCPLPTDHATYNCLMDAFGRAGDIDRVGGVLPTATLPASPIFLLRFLCPTSVFYSYLVPAHHLFNIHPNSSKSAPPQANVKHKKGSNLTSDPEPRLFSLQRQPPSLLTILSILHRTQTEIFDSTLHPFLPSHFFRPTPF